MRRAIPIGAGLLGIVLALRTMIFSGFRLVPGDAGDTRFCQLLLEYSYRWLLGREGGRPYWDFPVFHPVKNALAYSETLLGVGPFYWFWRALGVGADSSYALWLITMLLATFGAAYLLFRRGLGLSELASVAGAWLLAFGSPRIAQLNHPQLAPFFWGLLAVYAVARAWRDPGPRPGAWPWMFGAGMALQFYTGFYTAVFLSLSAIVAVVAALAFPWTRKAFGRPLRDPIVVASWVAAGVASLLALYPIGIHYAEAARSVGLREYWHVEAWLPRVPSWLYLGESSWLYGWLSTRPIFQSLPMSHEQQLGIGIATSTLVLLGLGRAWKERASARVALCVLATLLLTATFFPPDVSLWKIWYHAIPGISALRSVSRIGIFLLLPAALGLALWTERFRARPALLALGLSLVFLEQGRAVPSFDIIKAREPITEMSARIEPARCAAFFAWVTEPRDAPWKYQIDAMWAAVETSVPTLNGYSGNFPAGWWDLYDVNVRSAQQLEGLKNAVVIWSQAHGLEHDKVCLVGVSVK